MDVENEQLFHDLEERHISLRKEHEATCAERDALKCEPHNVDCMIFINKIFPVKAGSLQETVNDLREQVTVLDKKASENNLEIRQVSSYFICLLHFAH